MEVEGAKVKKKGRHLLAVGAAIVSQIKQLFRLYEHQ